MAIKSIHSTFDRNPIPSRPVAQTTIQIQRRHIRSQLPSHSGVAPRKLRTNFTQSTRFAS